MTLTEYGKGYFLCPDKDHCDFGKPYYHNGWWMETKQGQEGWFFKEKFLNNVLARGAKLV